MTTTIQDSRRPSVPSAVRPFAAPISLENACSPKAADFIRCYVDPRDPNVRCLATSTQFNVDGIRAGSNHAIVNLRIVNDIRYLNKFFEAVNAKLPTDGLLIACLETQDQRRARLFRKIPRPLFYPYYALDFILKRVLPKWKPTQGLYFLITRGQNRVLSLAETLGRLICCGFDIIEYEEIENLTYLVVAKRRPPSFDMQPTYGFLCHLNRIAKDGKIIRVCKLRTMHPYSEYLQGYLFEHQSLRFEKGGGKFKEDFRITSWGRFCRKFWIDELPMLINWVRGEVKLVGVRPLSPRYFSLYPEDLREERTQHMPGLVPPFYADLPSTFDEIIESERHYLLAYQRHPIRTDVRYFARALWNIVFKHARSI